MSKRWSGVRVRPLYGASLASICLGLVVWCGTAPSFTAPALGAATSSCPAGSDAYSQAVLADNPVAYYRLDETAGPTLCDSSSSGDNGTYGASGITYGVAGPLIDHTPAVTADGSADLVGQSGSDPAGLTGNHAYTLEAWFKNDQANAPFTNAWLVGLGGTGSTGQAAVLSLDPNHNSQLGWGPTSSFGIDQYGSDWAWDPTSVGVNLWDGNWHYIAVTYTPSNSASASDYVGYVDGHDVGSPDARPFGNAVPDIAASPITLGQGCSAGGCYWLPLDAGLAEVAVYPTALTTQRIDAHYAAATTQPAACDVPNVKGKTLAAAKSALGKAHCGTGTVTEKYSKTVKKGRVISQKPAAGQQLAAGTKVDLTVSKGRKRR